VRQESERPPQKRAINFRVVMHVSCRAVWSSVRSWKLTTSHARYYALLPLNYSSYRNTAVDPASDVINSPSQSAVRRIVPRCPF
jgi:hypothetical protein